MMNIKDVTLNIIKNYNENVEIYIQMLKDINCDLIYCDKGLENCIYERTVYACSIQYIKKNKKKKLRSVLPIMIGSKLDVAIRKCNLTQIDDLKIIPDIWDTEFQTADIAITCFLINGTLKQIPFFITNDATNPHTVKNSIVRLYRYDSNEKGKELSYYFDNIDGFNRGSLVVRLNDGNHSYDVKDFFNCPYPVDTKTYFERIFQQGFKIDNLENRIVISPGHLFLKLFAKNLYIPLKNQDYDGIIKKYNVVVKSITNGDLLHIISKKTLFFKETNTKHKMVNVPNGNQQREIGMNDEIYIEKKSTPYRDANCQCYPYLPYISHFTNLQISSKVKSVKVLSYNNSYIGFLCVLGTSETKNVGRIMMLTRNTFVSTQGNVDEVFNFLDINIVRGKSNPADKMTFLGTITGENVIIASQTMHLHIVPHGDKSLDIYFTKPNFEIVKWKVSSSFLFISIQRFHECSAGDKLCSLHGQKGVLQKHAKLPYAKEIQPDMIINPYCLISRQTMGQLVEAIHSGGKDYYQLYNSDDKSIQGSAFIGSVFYFLILYLSSEHIYAAINCKKDKVIGQAVRGRSRGGGMKYGTMETLNGGIGTGMASATEEIIGEHSDRIVLDIPLPQSVVLCNEDANFYKCNIEYKVEPPIHEI
ncbi:RNA_pol_Rpb2_6 domain-containing protein [Trichonephila clavata]|uniref:DNA-directed RNA polymerase n=1 Tax=Trichonephila clavata TaxID=2740835 RepID=A0A8X6FB65_TRICU|nr:RNA_pol_Rpb2_6 domain-containing protein [Trichonephila clavata]